MESKFDLFASICSVLGPVSSEIRMAVWDCIKNYNITSTAATTSYDDSVKAFIDAKRVDGLSHKTLLEYQRILSGAKEAFGGLPPADISTDHIRSYLAHLSERLRPASVHTYTNTLRSFFSWMHQEGQLERNPMSKIHSRKQDIQRARHPLSQKELERTRRACQKPRDRALLELMASTGCRVSEIRNIRRTDLDFQHHSISVVGKGSKTRMVLFSPRAELALEEYLAAAPESVWLFPGRGTGPLSVRAIQRALETVGHRAMLPNKLHPHILRHTFATQAINRGMDLPILQQLLGHANPNTTEIYAKLSPVTVARAYARAIA